MEHQVGCGEERELQPEHRGGISRQQGPEPNFRSLGGQISAGIGSAGGRGSLCKGLEPGQGQSGQRTGRQNNPHPPAPVLRSSG